ncbi:hypothetical protein QBC34DRAFT_416873 [Podospora aff. communis PSN243]|uniref:Uncharacterized protein n=1 Tax=Podospora aff. communis PSN243 TaxID=3040156 RepID=A0AAV9G4Z6_9PEZI|nr:hypothetical protein QBC34DRAFT_416873 [Podospora aff. communis PSN243]
MPEPVERGQSPPPERSSGKQMHDPPASGHGTDDASNKEETNKRGLENLESNPKWPLEEIEAKKFAKPSKTESSS